MISNNPLSYGSLQCVLEYMDANQRFLISQRCPDLCSVEKLVPMKLDYLGIKPLSFQFNNTNYKVSLVKNRLITADSNGLTVLEAQEEALPGESFLTALQRNQIDWHDVNQEVRKGLVHLERNNHSVKAYKHIKSYRELSQYVIFMTLNKPLPFNDVIQLEINGTEREQVKYTKSAYDAMKYLYWKFFDRTGLVTVKTLVLGLEAPIRLPVGLKIQPRKLFINLPSFPDFSLVERILDTSQLEVIAFQTREVINHPFLLRSPLLTYDGPISFDLHTLEHPRVHFPFHSPEMEPVMEMIQHWLRNGKPVGTLYSWLIYKIYQISEWMDKLKKIDGVKVVEDLDGNPRKFSERLILPMPGLSELHVYCQPGIEFGGIVWNFILEVKEA